MSLLLALKWLPESRILAGYFTVQLMFIIMRLGINRTANYVHYNIGYVIISIVIRNKILAVISAKY